MKKIRKILGVFFTFILGVIAGGTWEGIKQEKRLDDSEEQYKKMKCFYDLLIHWLRLEQDGKTLAEYFSFNNYHTIAIYGMKELGERLIQELAGTDISIKYIVDQNCDKIATNLPKYKPGEDLPDVDAMVVTAIYYYEDIEEAMSKKMYCPIISLEDVVYGLE